MVSRTPDGMDLLVALGQGNPGALNICALLAGAGHDETLRAMWRLGITGSLVWLTWKDLGDMTLERFVANVESQDLSARLAALGYAPTPNAGVAR